MNRIQMSRIFMGIGILGLVGALTAVAVGHLMDFGVPLLFIGLFWLLFGWQVRNGQ